MVIIGLLLLFVCLAAIGEDEDLDDDDLSRDCEKDPSVVCCDDNCGALADPQTPEEIKAAYEHWHNHGNLYGCAHGR